MPSTVRTLLLCAAGVVACGQTACNMVPRRHLALSQNRTRQLYDQNKLLAGSAASQSSQLSDLQRQITALQSDREIDKQLLNNANRERTGLRERYANLLKSTRNTASPLSAESTRQFQELARRYPDFEFDPQTGVSKFHKDILFSSGSADVRTSADPLLHAFARILNTGDAKELNILVVGHTDDRRIAKRSTKSKHPTNWHLSAHRAINVTNALAKHGLKERRMGVAGYGPHQPLVPNRNSKSRQKNRRVEIFVLAPNALVAGRDTSVGRR